MTIARTYNVIVNPENAPVPGLVDNQPAAPTLSIAAEAALVSPILISRVFLRHQAPELKTPAIAPDTVFGGTPAYTPPGTLASSPVDRSATVTWDSVGKQIVLWLYDPVRRLFWQRAYAPNIVPQDSGEAGLYGVGLLFQLYPASQGWSFPVRLVTDLK